MVDDAYVNHVPVLTGGLGKDQLREFYSRHFIPKMPPDTKLVPLSRTVSEERIVDEFIFSSLTLSRWIGCSPASRPPENASKCRQL